MDAAAFAAGRCRKTGSHILKDTDTPFTETRAIEGEQLGSREMVLRQRPSTRREQRTLAGPSWWSLKLWLRVGVCSGYPELGTRRVLETGQAW